MHARLNGTLGSAPRAAFHKPYAFIYLTKEGFKSHGHQA
jgi:hypothetical protein